MNNLSCITIILFLFLSTSSLYAKKTIFDKFTCTKCHEVIDRNNIHKAAKKNCQDCHFKHGYLKRKRNKLKLKKQCLDCHTVKNIHKSGVMSYHPIKGKKDPLTNKELSCLSCHNPHSSSSSKLFRYRHGENTVYEGSKCLVCHWQKGSNQKAPNNPKYKEPIK